MENNYLFIWIISFMNRKMHLLQELKLFLQRILVVSYLRKLNMHIDEDKKIN